MSLLMLAARTLNESDFDYLESLLHRTGKEAEERMSELFWVALADATSNQFFQRDTRFWFRVVRQEIGVDPDADIDVAVRRAVYLQLVTDLREKKDPYIAYKPFVEQLMERMEAADSR